MTLTDFLLARIAEDEEDICHCCDDGLETRMGFARAECEAKRRIVERFSGGEGLAFRALANAVLVDLALPYSDHPDYRAEWKP